MIIPSILGIFGCAPALMPPPSLGADLASHSGFYTEVGKNQVSAEADVEAWTCESGDDDTQICIIGFTTNLESLFTTNDSGLGTHLWLGGGLQLQHRFWLGRGFFAGIDGSIGALWLGVGGTLEYSLPSNAFSVYIHPTAGLFTREPLQLPMGVTISLPKDYSLFVTGAWAPWSKKLLNPADPAEGQQWRVALGFGWQDAWDSQ